MESVICQGFLAPRFELMLSKGNLKKTFYSQQLYCRAAIMPASNTPQEASTTIDYVNTWQEI